MSWGLDGAALDRHITGNYGEDYFTGDEERCEDCDRAEDCPFDFDTIACAEDAAAAAADNAADLARELDS